MNIFKPKLSEEIMLATEDVDSIGIIQMLEKCKLNI